MFGPDFFIDTFQDAKKNITNTVFTDKTLNKVANNFIEAQTVFAKMLVKNTLDVGKYSVDSISKFWFPVTNQEK
jgi:hypothetical protein